MKLKLISPKEPQENQIDLKETKASIVSLFLDVIYEEPEKPVKPESFKLLSTWTRLYILGEKYIAPAAQNKARQMVQQLRQGPLTADDIIESLELLYSGMASKSFKFRDELIPVVVGYKKDLVHNPRFLELLRPEYSMQHDLLSFMLLSGPFVEYRSGKNSLYACSKCFAVFHCAGQSKTEQCLVCHKNGIFRVQHFREMTKNK